MTDSTSTSSASVPDWITRLAESRVGLAVLSAAESTVLPIPLEAVLIPLMVGRPSHALRIGLWALLGCLVGSFLLYGAGLLAQPLVDPVLQWLGLTEAFEEMQTRLTGGNLFVTVVIIAVSPAPGAAGLFGGRGCRGQPSGVSGWSRGLACAALPWAGAAGQMAGTATAGDRPALVGVAFRFRRFGRGCLFAAVNCGMR